MLILFKNFPQRCILVNRSSVLGTRYSMLDTGRSEAEIPRTLECWMLDKMKLNNNGKL